MYYLHMLYVCLFSISKKKTSKILVSTGKVHQKNDPYLEFSFSQKIFDKKCAVIKCVVLIKHV